jgi:hypothetical protein
MTNPTQTEHVTDAGDVLSSISYMVAMADKPARYLGGRPDGAPELNWRLEARATQVRNGRPHSSSIRLDKHGFALRELPSQVTDFHDQAAVLKTYYAEVEQFIKDETGAAKVVAFDYNTRSASKEGRQKTGAFPPALFAHADYTTKSAAQRVRDLLPEPEASERLARRHVFLNVWRPIRGPIENDALAVCDAQSIAPGDLALTDLIYPDRMGEIYNITFNPNHRWYYFRHMRDNEALIITNFDSHSATVVPHTSFTDPNATPDAAPRESVEVRVIAFFE